MRSRVFHSSLFILILMGYWCMGTFPNAMAENSMNSPQCQSPGFPRFTFDESHIFPNDRPLARPEDGKSLPDGRMVVGDERFGLVLINPDGTHQPFGKFKEAGYVHNPPDFPGGPNGLFLEHDGRHVLRTDIYTGKIFRVDTETEETQLIYDHPYGVNSIYRDRKGTIWFTQSTNNSGKNAKKGLWDATDQSIPTGAIFSLSETGDEFALKAEQVASHLYLANGMIFDHSEQYMYVSESMMDRVLRYKVDVRTKTISDRETYQLVPIPDNLAMDAQGNLWIVSFFYNQVSVVDQHCRSLHRVFRPTSKKRELALDEWSRRSHLGLSRLEVLTGDTGKPLPFPLTGLFFSQNDESVYFTGLGNAILRYPMPPK